MPTFHADFAQTGVRNGNFYQVCSCLQIHMTGIDCTNQPTLQRRHDSLGKMSLLNSATEVKAEPITGLLNQV